MAKRKTVSVKDMVDYANLQLSRTDEIATKDFKIGI
jgi:histone H3/H4